MITLLHNSPLKLVCKYHAVPVDQLWSVLKVLLILKSENKFETLMKSHGCTTTYISMLV